MGRAPLRLLALSWLAALACLCVGAPAVADPSFPKFTGVVVDAANVIPDDQEATLTQKLEAFQQQTHRQLVVATIPDLQGDSLEDYGYKLLRTWGVGLKDANNGAILFVAPNQPAGQRGPRIEVGYGLEPVLTDALSSVIINQDMMPKLRAGDVPGALDAGTDAIIQQLSLPDADAKAKQDAAVAAWNKDHARRSSNDSGGGIGVIIWLADLGCVVSSMLRGRRRHGPWGATRYGGSNWPIVLWGLGQALSQGGRGRDDDWGGGGGWGGGSSGGGGWGGGGFTGGGGGSGGGGGASGSW